MNMFSTPQGFFNTIPQVDIEKSWNMFGAPQPADQTQSLWGNTHPPENTRKGKAGTKNKKELRIS
jgi:hypothetical protein